MSQLLVAVKLDCEDSQGVLQYVLRSVADGQDVMHVLCVILQRDGAGQRLQAQTDIRQQYGTQLKNHKHKLHIIRVIMRGSKEDKPAVAAYVARAICAKATLLHANVIVVGGKERLAASGLSRSSAVAEGVRRHSCHPVLCISPEHPLLEEALPSIAEEPYAAPGAQGLHMSCRRATSLPHQILGDQHLVPHSMGPASCPLVLDKVRWG